MDSSVGCGVTNAWPAMLGGIVVVGMGVGCWLVWGDVRVLEG
jgi:hypothetical protein